MSDVYTRDGRWSSGTWWSSGGLVYRPGESGSRWDEEEYSSFSEWTKQIPDGAVLHLTGKVEFSHSEASISLDAVGRDSVSFHPASVGVYFPDVDTRIYFLAGDPNTAISFIYDPEEAEK